MNTPETINIEKYVEALNDLVGIDIGYLGDSDENVNAIVEVIRAAKVLENRVKELEEVNKKWQDRLDREAKCQYDLAGKIVDLKEEVEVIQRKLQCAENCIYAIEDGLDRGIDNDWARKAIEHWESVGKR